MTDRDRRRHQGRRIDAGDRAVGAVRHPERARARRDRGRLVADVDRSGLPAGAGVELPDVTVGIHDPDRPGRWQHRPGRSEGEQGAGGKLPRRDGTVVLRVDPGDLTGGVAYPDGTWCGGERRRGPADRDGCQDPPGGQVDAGYGAVIEVRHPQRIRRRNGGDRACSHREDGGDRTVRVEGDDGVGRDRDLLLAAAGGRDADYDAGGDHDGQGGRGQQPRPGHAPATAGRRRLPGCRALGCRALGGRPFRRGRRLEQALVDRLGFR